MMTNILATQGPSLPNELWSSVFELIEEPQQVASVSKLFKDLYEDKNITCRWLLKNLNSRGLYHISKKLEDSRDLALAKDKLIIRVITLRPQSTLEYFKNSESLPVHGFIKLLQEEKDINLISLYEKIPLEKTDFTNLALHSKALAIREFLQNNKAKLELIEELDLRNLSLTAVPEELELFSGLKKINLSGNDIDFLPSSFGANWKKLEKCDLSSNKFDVLPDDFGKQWEMLKSLNVNDNHLKSFPDSYVHWKKLDALWIKHNQIPAEQLQQIREAFPHNKWLVR